MEVEEALVIVRSLAEGLDPGTGQPYPDQSPLQQAPIVRALLRAATALQEQEGRARRRAELPPNTGVPWDEKDDAALGSAFDEGRTVEQLAALHKRTSGAIRARLMKLGRVI